MLGQEPKNTSTNPELQKYYKYLRENNADVPPTYSSFENTLKDPKTAQAYYSYLKSNNFDAPETFDSFQSTFGLKKKDSTSTSTSPKPKSASEQKVGSSGTQEFELKPVFDERGRQVKIKNEKGELVPYMEKVPKGFASSTEEREIVREEQKKKASKPIIPSANLTKYKEATKITDDEKAVLQQEVEDEFNQQGIWNGMKTGMKKGFNTLANVVTTIGTFGSETEAPIQMEVDPFAKEKKQAKEELVAEKKAVTPQAIAERAKQIKIQNRLDGLKVDKNNEYLSNLPEEEIKALNLEKVREYKTLSDKDKYLATKAELLKNDFEKDAKDLFVARAILEKNKKEGVVPNENLINFAIEKQESVKNKLAEAEELEKEYLTSKDNIGTAEEEIDFLKRNYDTTDKVTTLAKLGLGDLWNSVSNKLPLMVSDINEDIFNTSSGVLTDEERQELIDESIDWENAKELAKSVVKRDVDFDNLSVDNFGQFFFQELGTQLPIFAQMAMPGGIVSIGMTSTFDKYGRMEQESNNIAFEFNGKQFSGFEKENGEIVDSLGNTYDPNEVKITSLRTPDQSTANKFLTSVTFGTAEAVLGALPTKNIFGRALNSLSTSGERTLFRESIKQFAKAKGAGVLDATVTEVVSEGATQVVQNIADIASGKKDVGVFDNVDHAAVSAGMLSFFMSASPAVAGIALKPFSQNKENRQVNDNLQQIFALQEQLNNAEISDVSRAAIQNKIEGLEKANGDILDGIASRTKGISKEVFDAIKDVNKKQEILTIQATEIKNDPSLDVEVKKQLIADLESQFNQLEKKRATLVGGNATVLDALPDSESTRLKQNAAETLVKEEKAKGKDDSEINFTEEQINAKAIEIYNQSNQNAVQQEATITETQQEAQPQAEVQETEQEVLATPTAEDIVAEDGNNISDINRVEIFEKSDGTFNVRETNKDGTLKQILGRFKTKEEAQTYLDTLKNETTQTINTTTDGNVQPTIGEVAEVGGTTEQTTEDVTTESIPQAVEPTTSKRETKRVVSKTARNPKTGEAAEFDVDIVDGQVVEIRKPRTGKVVPKFVEVKDKVTGKVKRVQRNANWTAIADEALGFETSNRILEQEKKATEEAIQSFEPVNEYDYALQFFATGGNVNSQSAQRETGLSNKEVKWATGFKPDSELPSVEAIAEKIVMDAEKSGVNELDMQEVRNALIDIIKSYTRDSVKQEIVDTQKARQQEQEQAEINAYLSSLTKEEYNEYKRMEAEYQIEQAEKALFEGMSENEIRDYFQQQFNEQQQFEQEFYGTEQQTEQRREEQNTGTNGTSVQEIQGESKSERLTDQINDILDDFDKRLRDFGNETLGVNIPVVIARGAIKAMKLANNGVATLEDVVQAGIDYIKSTDWYANLSDVNKTAIDKNTFMSVLDSTIKANDAAKKTIESLRQKIQDNKTNSKQIVADIKNFLANNSIEGVLTPAQANALIIKANEILTAKDTLKAFDSFVQYYNKVKDKAENKLNEKAKAKLRYEKQKQRVLDLKSQGKSLSQTISTLEAEKGKPLSEKEKQMVELIFKTGDVANMTDNDVNQVVDGALEKSREAVRKSNNGWTKLKEKFKGLRAKFLDAQADAKRIIKSNQLGTVLDRLIALKGASAKAEMVFNEAKEKIYSGLKTEQRKVLDEIIMLRRILAIDENRAKKGLTPVLHPDFITGEIAKRKLEIIKAKIGDQAYADLNNRADIYFDEFRNILNEMQKSGLISQQTRDELFDVDYQPRKFLHYLMNGDEEISENAKSWQKSTFSLSGDQIKALEEGSIEPLVLDSEWLLATAMSMRYKSIFMNALNSKLASEFNKKESEIKALKAIPENQRTKAEKKKIAEFEKMKEVFIDNPIIGVTKSGNPKYKFDTTPAGYRIAYYYKNGVQNKFFIKENIYEQWYNEKKFINNPKLLENLSIVSGSKLLKAMATGKNPFFLITNIPRDFMSVMLVSPEYSKFKPLAIGQLFKDLGKSFMAIRNKNDMFEKYFEYGGGMSFLSTEGMLTGKSFVTDLMESKSHNKIVAGLLDAKVKENAVKWLNNLTLNEINQYSELIFRISVFNRSIQNQLKELGVSDINTLSQEQQDDIYFRAVASARSIMDFNQGGYITKDMESVMPYLNAATQGSRVLFDAFAERPFETTSNILQLTTIGITSAIGASLAAISMFSDEDEERSSMEIYLDNMSMVSPHDRRNNFIIFTGKKDEEGNPIYIKIAKAQQITPFTVISEHIVLNKLRRDYGIKEDGKLFEKSLDAINDNISPIQWLSFREDPTLIGTSLIARNPFGRAVMTYTTGYDFYRQEKLSWDIDKKGVPKYMEGYSSDRVDDFYKEIGMDLEMSPVRMKAMVESVLTSPSTNPYLGIMYGGLDAAITDKSFKEKSKVAIENTLKNVSKRITNVGKPYNKTLEEKEELKKKIEVIQAENIIFNAKIDDIAKDYINKKDSKEVFRNKLIKELKLEPFKADRAVNRIVDKIKFKDVDPFYIDLKYEQDNEVKALMLFNHLGDVKKLKMEDRKKIGEQLEKIGFKLNEEIANEYMKFVREYEER